MNIARLRAAIAIAVAASSCLPANVLASDTQGLAEVKQMIQQMKQQYEERIEALEKRVRVAEEKAESAEDTATRTETRVDEAEILEPAPVQASANSFNPAISFVLQGGAVSYSEDPDDYHLEGMPLGGEAGLQAEGLSLWEAEMTVSANVDNLFYGQATIGLHQDDGEVEVDIEEAFLDTLSLPAGLGLRFGRFYSDIGYLNTHHTHAWDFADAPLAYQAFLGKQYRDDGLRMTWIAPTEELLVEAGVEVLRGDTYPGGGNSGDLGDVKHGFIHIGGDVGDSSSWQLGISHMDIDVVERTSGGHAHGADAEGPTFGGDSDLSAIDFVWKSEFPSGRKLILQGEYFLRDEDGQVTLSEDAGDALFNYDGKQSGWYAQGIFQFAPQWRTGIRYDRLDADNKLAMVSNATGESDDDIFEESGFESSSHDPDRWTVMFDWSPSEFSRLRMQYARDNSREESDDQFMIQYIMSLGAHGSHQY
jgi:hypothetical protein